LLLPSSAASDVAEMAAVRKLDTVVEMQFWWQKYFVTK
jgi:hypothetical protein